jgi:hypothetical protein
MNFWETFAGKCVETPRNGGFGRRNYPILSQNASKA